MVQVTEDDEKNGQPEASNDISKLERPSVDASRKPPSSIRPLEARQIKQARSDLANLAAAAGGLEKLKKQAIDAQRLATGLPAGFNLQNSATLALGKRVQEMTAFSKLAESSFPKMMDFQSRFPGLIEMKTAEALTRSFKSSMGLTSLEKMMETMRDLNERVASAGKISGINSVGNLSKALADKMAPMKTFMEDLQRHQSLAFGPTSSYGKILARVSSMQDDMRVLAAPSIAAALSASLLISPPPNLDRSLAEITAIATRALRLVPDRELWQQAGEESLLLRGVGLLDEMESRPAQSGNDFDQQLNRLVEAVESAVANATTSSQQVSLLQVIFFLVPLVISILTMVQAEMHHREDMAKPDGTTAIVEQLNKNGEKLDKLDQIAASLQEATKHVSKAVAVRTANIRRAPDKTAQLLGKLQQGNIVVVSGTVENWLQVEFSDPVTGQTVTGWVYAKLMKRFQ